MKQYTIRYIRFLSLPLALGAGVLAMGAEPSGGAPTIGRAADNKIYAQVLVMEMMKSNPHLVIGGFHAVAPGAKSPSIIASTLDRIGAPDDEGDISVGVGGRTILVPNLKNPNRTGLLLPLLDKNGRRIGALALAFRPTDEGDETKIYLEGVAIRDSLAKKIPELGALFVPVETLTVP